MTNLHLSKLIMTVRDISKFASVNPAIKCSMKVLLFIHHLKKLIIKLFTPSGTTLRQIFSCHFFLTLCFVFDWEDDHRKCCEPCNCVLKSDVGPKVLNTAP